MSRQPFCHDCPDHEACSTGWPCALVLTDHTAADECRDEFRDDVERELREYGVELP